jgi:hypothetical protein
MNTVWVFGNASQIMKLWPAPPYITGYLNYGGSAYGNETNDPVVNHYFEDDQQGHRKFCNPKT